MGFTVGGFADSDAQRERSWRINQFKYRDAPPNVLEGGLKTKVTIEAPSLSDVPFPSGTATGTGQRRAKVEPLAKDLPLRTKVTHSDIEYDGDRILPAEQMYRAEYYGPKNKPQRVDAPQGVNQLLEKTPLDEIEQMTDRKPEDVRMLMFHQSAQIVIWDNGNSFLTRIRGEDVCSSSFPISRSQNVKVANAYHELFRKCSSKFQRKL